MIRKYEHIAIVSVAENAVMSIPMPELEWQLRYGKEKNLNAASCIESYSYLISANITIKESIRRLRILRAAHKEIRSAEGKGEL